MDDPLGWYQGFMLGVLGGFIGEVPGLFQLKKEWAKNREAHPEWPQYFKSKKYWLITVGLMLLGGGWVCVWMAEHPISSAFLAMNLGLTAPLAAESALRQLVPAPTFKTN